MMATFVPRAAGLAVMAGLDPAIHAPPPGQHDRSEPRLRAFASPPLRQLGRADGQTRSGHDGFSGWSGWSGRHVAAGDCTP
jgi:hypothetical protein